MVHAATLCSYRCCHGSCCYTAKDLISNKLWINADVQWVGVGVVGTRAEKQAGCNEGCQAYAMAELLQNGVVVRGFERQHCILADQDGTSLPLEWGADTEVADGGGDNGGGAGGDGGSNSETIITDSNEDAIEDAKGTKADAWGTVARAKQAIGSKWLLPDAPVQLRLYFRAATIYAVGASARVGAHM
jgi:hypothetical protein